MPLLDHVRSLGAEIRAVAAASGASDVRVFGSVARGDEHADSDVDFLVDLEPGRSLFDLARLGLDLEELLGLPVDVATVNSLRHPVRESALREAVPV